MGNAFFGRNSGHIIQQSSTLPLPVQHEYQLRVIIVIARGDEIVQFVDIDLKNQVLRFIGAARRGEG